MDPLLGSEYLVSTNSTKPTLVTASLCANLTAFKALMRESRTLDDSAPIRLNRLSALERKRGSDGGECDAFWKELLKRWKERQQVLTFCESVVEPVEDGGRVDPRRSGDDVRELDKDRRTAGRGETLGQVKRRQIHNEIRVEEIVRSRTLSFFASRCPNHPQLPKPPLLATVEDGEVVLKRGRDSEGHVRWSY